MMHMLLLLLMIMVVYKFRGSWYLWNMLLLLLINIISKVCYLMMIIIICEIGCCIIKFIFFGVQSLEIAWAEIIIIGYKVFMFFKLATNKRLMLWVLIVYHLVFVYLFWESSTALALILAFFSIIRNHFTVFFECSTILSLGCRPIICYIHCCCSRTVSIILEKS